MITKEPGIYDGTVTAATIYEAPSGAVMCRMKVDVGGANLSGGICLVQKDGALSERGFRDVQAIFGWSDWDWARWDQSPESFAGAAVQAVVETVQGDKDEFSSCKYINPPGGGGMRLEQGNAKAMAAKYGAKTRALFGGAPAMRPATLGPRAAPRPPVAVPPVAVPHGPPPAISTMEACWDVFQKSHDALTEPELYDLWPKAITNAVGKGQNDCTPEDWGRVLKMITPS